MTKIRIKEWFKNNKNFIIIFLTMFIFHIIVLLSFYPGIITHDGRNQWNQVVANDIINNHPFFSTYIWWVLAKIWNSPTSLLVFQILLISIIWASICKALKDKNNFKKQLIYTVILCFIPIIFLYTVTAWKDLIYSYMLLLMSLMIYVGIKKNFNYSYFDLIIICFSLTWTCNYRYNGIIAVGLLIISLIIILFKNRIKKRKIIAFISFFIIIFTICKLPEKIMLKPEHGPNASGNDIVFFVLSSLVNDDKIDEENDLAVIDKIYPIEKIKEDYNPFLINSLASSKSFNRVEYGQHSKEISNMLLKYTFRHPFTVIKHYLSADNLLIGLTYKEGYVYVFDFDYWDNGYTGNFNKKTQPIFDLGYKFYLKLITLSTKGKLKYFYLPAYCLYFSIIFMIIYCRKYKDKRYFLVLLPMFYNTLSLAPINVAQDLRYVYINYLTLLLIVVPLFIFRQKHIVLKENKKKIKDGKTLVIIPAYNESESIEKVVNLIYKQKNEKLDIIVVNDGSKDNTYEEASKTKAIVIDSPSNLGIGGAVQTGYLYAYKNNYDFAIQVDGDGQHNPKYLKEMINILKTEDVDMVIGSRFVGDRDYDQTFMRMLGINIISFVIEFFTNKKIYDTTSGFRAINKDVIKEFVNDYPYDYPEPVTTMQIILKGYNVKEIPVKMEQRTTGISSISPVKSVMYMFKVTLALFLNIFRKY